jgi:hypothetical protein
MVHPRVNSDVITSGLTLRGQELRVETMFYAQAKLKFYVANPRIYTAIRQGGAEPTQEDIETRLQDMEHVRELVLEIKRNGGLIEPLIVKPETLEVLEGNSRLAAYRLLNRENAITWAMVKCSFLPIGLDDKTIFALLGQYHIKGKKSWAPYEQAGFLYRRYTEHGLKIEELAKEIGLKAAEAKLYIETFEFMVEHDDTDQLRWSYYFEYLKSRKIKKIREKFDTFDTLIVEKIKDGEIAKATDVRDMLPKVCEGPPTLLKRFASGQIGFQDTIERLVDSGADNSVYKRIMKFRQWLAEDDVKKAIIAATSEEKRRIAFELDKINSRSKLLAGKANG